jgi:hypothetical protein
MAIYHCMSKPISEIYDIFQKTELSQEDRRMCTMALQRLKASEILCITSTIRRTTKCTASSCISLVEVGLASVANSEGADPLAETSKVLKKFGLCSICTTFSRAKHVSERVLGWNTIPDMLRASCWEDLAAMRVVALSA